MMVELRALRKGLTLKPLEDRGQERLRRAGLTGVTSACSQGLTILTGLISIPLTVHYLGQERYGIWLTINSLLNWLTISNLGFAGNALVNALAEAHGKNDRELARELVATAFWSLFGIAALLTLVFAIASPAIPWHRVFNATSAVPSGELRSAAMLSFLGFVLMFPNSLVDAVYQSYQEGYIGNLWGMAGGLLSLGALVVVTQMEGGLPLLILALYGVRVVVAFANICYLFGLQYPWLTTRPQAARKRSFLRVTSLGYKYLLAQLAGIGMFQSQPIIIAQVLGAAQVGIFNVTQRVMTLPLNVIQMFTFPLLAAYGEAQARQDWDWIRRTLRRSIVTSTLATTFMVICLGAGASTVLRLWVGPAMVPSGPLIVGLSLYVLIAGAVTPASVMLYGLKRVGAQALFAIANAAVTIALGIWLTQTWGLAGTAAAMAIACAAVNPVAQISQIRSVFRCEAYQTWRRKGTIEIP